MTDRRFPSPFECAGILALSAAAVALALAIVYASFALSVAIGIREWPVTVSPPNPSTQTREPNKNASRQIIFAPMGGEN